MTGPTVITVDGPEVILPLMEIFPLVHPVVFPSPVTAQQSLSHGLTTTETLTWGVAEAKPEFT